jgi:signal peptide peptidase SppA
MGLRDYVKVLTKIRETPWLITQEGLEVILGIVNERLANGKLTDEEIQARLGMPGSGESSLNKNGNSNGYSQNIGVLPLQGPLFGKANLMTEMSGATSLEMFRQDFRTMMADPGITDIILEIDSPGGTSELVQEVGDEIFAARGVKPVYALADTTAGSAAYWLASQADKLYATSSGMVGSIGAYTVHEDQSGHDEQQGRHYTYVSAGEYKTEGNPHQPLSDEGREYRQEVIDELYGDFVSAVSKGRNKSGGEVMSDFGGGRMLTSKSALAAGMIDGIMSMDDLVGQIGSAPQQVTITNQSGVAFASGQLTDGVVTLDAYTTPVGLLNEWPARNDWSDARLESKDMEHSEPGTGSPPAPRIDESGADDLAIQGRWRRDQLPRDPNDPTSPTPNPPPPHTKAWKEDSKLSAVESTAKTAEEIVAELRTGLNLKPDEDLVSNVRNLFEESQALEASVAAASQEGEFATKYPALWAEHQDLLNDRAESRAKLFAANVQTIGQMEGEVLKPSKLGLSALAVEEIAQCHMKFAAGHASLADFENVVTRITQGGIVQYGETGSARQAELPASFDPSTAEGVVGVRKEFAQKVAEIQKNDNLSYPQALSEATKAYPELAAAYRMAVPINN